jgi:hypothetical protein
VGISSCEHGAHQNCHLAPVLAFAASPLLEVAALLDSRFHDGSYIDESKRLVPSAKVRSGVMRLKTR